MSSWKGVSSTTDHASNLTYDPASGIPLTWSARNQVATDSGFSEQYDGLGRREANSAGLSFRYDGSTMIGWSETGGSYNFTTLPGGGALAGSFTANGSTTTWVPLLDAAGSTIALVNAAATGSPPATTYTYDPSGTPTQGGASNPFWPFQYQGMEQEFIDAPYYYTGGGQFYSPQLVRSLSETSATSSQGTGGGPSGNGGGGGGGGGGSNPFLPSYDPFSTSGSQIASNLQNEAEAAGAALAAAGAYEAGAFGYALLTGVAFSELAGPPGWIVAAGIGLFELFDQLFGGGSDSPPIPRQLRHGRHPLYPVILGVSDGLIPTEASAGMCPLCGDAHPCPNARPLQKTKDPAPASTPNGAPQACRQAAFAEFESCIGKSSAVIIAAASLPCEATLLAGPAAFGTCEQIMTGLAVPTLIGAAGACWAQYKQEVGRCGQ